MKIKPLKHRLTVCKVQQISDIDLSGKLFFVGKTDEEISLVCETSCVPTRTVEREDGWRAFRIEGVLDFSLVGVLSEISAVLAAEKIGIFAVSTYNTDYILVKENNFHNSLHVLSKAGYTVV